ncbi:Replication protein A 70 kDa DNA-binding subunit C [Arachis hypogaea]|nr:Replication protein A 70 kDa DNA-binding subunit C [Arachis hypogaea]
MTAKTDLIRDINSTKLAWSLVMGVARLYEFPSQWNQNEVFSLEMVLQDEQGDRIHGTICKPGLDLFRERIKEHAVYSMWNFIVKINNEKVRTTAHKYKLSFYTKIEVEVLPINTFAFNPFKFCPFAELESNAPMDGNLLFDYIGEVVGKEEAMGIITRTGKESKRIALQLEDLEKHKIKCTLFGELVAQVLPHLERDDGEPFIMVVQLFKSNVYLNSVNVQSTYYVSKCYFNPNLPEVIDFKKRLAEEVVPCSQRITPLQSQPQYSVADEINAGIVPIRTIEEVLNMTQTCPKKILESKDRYWCDHCRRVGFKAMLRYRLQVIVTDESGWVYSVLKISDDEYLMSIFGPANSSFNASCSQHVLNTSTTETGDNSNGHETVSLSKDSAVESNYDSSYETPAKRSSPNIGDGSTTEAGVSVDVQASANKTFKRNCEKKKLD